MQFGALMKAMRKKANFTQEDLAFEIGVSQGTVSKIESNHLVPDALTLLTWADKTCAKDLLIAFMFSVDVSTVTQALSILVGGFINILI